MADKPLVAPEASVTVRTELSPDTFKALEDLAGRRGVDANTIIEQAIATEKLLSDHVGVNDELLIKRPDSSFAKITFSNDK